MARLICKHLRSCMISLFILCAIYNYLPNSGILEDNPKILKKRESGHYSSHEEKAHWEATEGESARTSKSTPTNIIRTVTRRAIQNNSYENIKLEILKVQEESIAREMDGYVYTDGISNFSDLLLKYNGKPVRNVIFSTWRSGSTFLGDLVNSHPASFYHYEPLQHLKEIQVQTPEQLKEGIRVVKALLRCDYSDIKEYTKLFERQNSRHDQNKRLWTYCLLNRTLCMDENFLSTMCEIFPFQVMKSVRLRLKFAEELLQDENLDVRILFLVRDPRGVMRSRNNLSWCLASVDCKDPLKLCSDMVDDYFSALILKEKYPNKIMMLRYEDISLNPTLGTFKLFKFFRLAFHQNVKAFIDTHTKSNQSDSFSTYQDSSTIPFRWIQYYKEKKEELTDLELKCNEAMTLWGYNLIQNTNNFDKMATLSKPPWDDMIIE